jgi:hypothetical protein
MAQFRRLDNVFVGEFSWDVPAPEKESGTTQGDCACGNADNLFH